MMKKGEVWKVTGRKGPLTIRLLEDVDDPRKDSFFDAEIVTGKVQYLSAENSALQRFEGIGTPGHAIIMRTTLTHFKERVDEEG